MVLMLTRTRCWFRNTRLCQRSLSASEVGQNLRLVQSLEVAEHLPASAAEQFVDNLVAHSAVVLFSAATLGQGGEHHVNERPYSYWRDLFSDRGYLMFDLIRPFVIENDAVEP